MAACLSEYVQTMLVAKHIGVRHFDSVAMFSYMNSCRGLLTDSVETCSEGYDHVKNVFCCNVKERNQQINDTQYPHVSTFDIVQWSPVQRDNVKFDQLL